MTLKKLFILLMLVLPMLPVRAQTVNDIFDPNTTVTWLGWDLTGAIFIGDREKFGSQSDIQRLMKSWNDLMDRERDKFNVAGMMKKKVKVEYKLDVTTNHNAELDISNILSEKSSDHVHLRKDGVEQIVGAYNYEGAKGIGLMFNIESLNKINNEASLWVTFVNMETGQVLLTERMTASPSGGGLRNFWAGAIVEIMNHVKKKDFEAWRKKYQRA
jgi:hypothetical protein